jgi:hypothetical protein
MTMAAPLLRTELACRPHPGWTTTKLERRKDSNPRPRGDVRAVAQRFIALGYGVGRIRVLFLRRVGKLRDGVVERPRRVGKDCAAMRQAQVCASR